MNKQNKNILNIMKDSFMVFLIIFILQIFTLFVLNIVLNKFIEEINLEETIKEIILLVSLILFAIVDVIFYKMYISRAKLFLNSKPIEGIIEDFILVSYGYTKDSQGFSRKDYKLYPIVKVNNELFFTYGNYCICHYNCFYVGANNSYNVTIFRKDKTKVNIGDKAYLYIKNKIKVNVDIDIKKNTYKLNKQIEHFNNLNKNYDINIMKKLNFFEGIVDVESIQ